jgi:dTDP-4-dehydrorhamnose 3,5-epimerase
MKVSPLSLSGVLLIEPKVHRDTRGFFVETFQAARYAEAGMNFPFVQDNHSRSAKNTLRGLHAQWRKPQGKLVRCVEGEIFDVAVDIRRGSPTFGRWAAATLSADNFQQIYVPPGYAHGFCVLSEQAQVEYKTTDLYDAGGELTVAWNDPAIGIAWPLADPVLSDKDAAGLTLEALGEKLPLFEA